MMLEGFGDAPDNSEYVVFTSMGWGFWGGRGRRDGRHGEPELDNFEENGESMNDWVDFNAEEVYQCEDFRAANLTMTLL